MQRMFLEASLHHLDLLGTFLQRNKEEENKKDVKKEDKKDDKSPIISADKIEKEKLSDVAKSKLDDKTVESIIIEWNDRLDALTNGFAK